MSEAQSADQIRTDIEVTRAELAETAEALAQRLDVKAQASAKAHAAGERITEDKARSAAIGGGIAAVLVAFVIWRVRRD